jgi:L-threonylcarbamoyladenylate synthase
MPTTIRSIDRDSPAPALIAEAAGILRRGGLVAFATETVYGLGADALVPEAVARIFEAKGRPGFNPLIVHAGDIAMARTCVADWPETAELLARQFWPGPLTFVLPRSGLIPDIVTGGLDTVGVRIPSPLVARSLIAALGHPLAAPSANRSNGISPTLAGHVASDLGARVELILDSGQTTVGLESTVLDLTTREPRVLRPGPITAEGIEHVLGGLRVREAVGDSAAVDEPLSSPGQMTVHYAPRTPAVRVRDAAALAAYADAWLERAALIVIGPHTMPEYLPVLPANRFFLDEPTIAARDLYVVLHQADALGMERIVVLPPADRPEWRAVRDRLQRATRPA